MKFNINLCKIRYLKNSFDSNIGIIKKINTMPIRNITINNIKLKKRNEGIINEGIINERKINERKINDTIQNIRNINTTKILNKEHKSFFEEEGLTRQLGGYGYPMMFIVTYDKPSWQPFWENEFEIIPRDEFGVPASIPPEISTKIKHTYFIPPHFYTFLKKLGDDTDELKPYMIKLIKGEFNYNDYEEMFYKFAKPLKIYRNEIPIAFRSNDEMKNEDFVKWQSAWLSYRQKILSEYNAVMYLREFLLYMSIGIYFAYLWFDMLKQYRLDMKLYYLEAPEHKINWVKPRGDLV